MAKRNRGPAFNPPPDPPEDRGALYGELVCCLGECSEVVGLALGEIRGQIREQLHQVAQLLQRILHPIQQAVLVQLQGAQDATDQITTELEDQVLHQLMQSAYLIQSLTEALPAVAGTSDQQAATPPSVPPAASGGMPGASLSPGQAAATQVTATAARPVPVGPPRPAQVPAPPTAAELPAPTRPRPTPAAFVPRMPAAPEFPPGAMPPDGIVGPMPAQIGGSSAAPPGVCPPFPVDWSQPLAFLFSGIAAPWQTAAVAWVGPYMQELAAAPSLESYYEQTKLHWSQTEGPGLQSTRVSYGSLGESATGGGGDVGQPDGAGGDRGAGNGGL